MGKIKKLPNSIVARIKAGEVVESPVSVVKELIENSIDAESSSIKVFIDGGGLEKILVVDDGMGISKEDLPLVIENHTTSKLEDLYSISTLGFRGEALFAIRMVSRISISSSVDGKEGYVVRAEGEKVFPVEPSLPVKGTRVEVKNLFFNTPARFKFVKGRRSLNNSIYSLITRYAISFFDISFSLTSEGKDVLLLSKDESIKKRLSSIYAEEFISRLIEIEKDFGEYKLYILVSPPDFGVSSKGYQVFWVNKRPVRLKGHGYIIQRAFDFFEGKNPVLFCFIEAIPEMIDVNIHPRKEEIAFYDEFRIYNTIVSVIKKELNVPKRILLDKEYKRKEVVLSGIRGNSGEEISFENRNIEKREYIQSLYEGLVNGDSFILGLRLIGNVFNTLFIAEGEDKLVLIDQHIAHERVLFEKLLDKNISSQMLLIPINIVIPEDSLERFYEIKEDLENIGFVFKLTGHDLEIKAIPSILDVNDVYDTISELLEGAKKGNSIYDIYATIACKSAIKSGDSIEMERFKKILVDLAKCKEPYKCPHGRDIFVILEKSEVFSWFKR